MTRRLAPAVTISLIATLAPVAASEYKLPKALEHQRAVPQAAEQVWNRTLEGFRSQSGGVVHLLDEESRLLGVTRLLTIEDVRKYVLGGSELPRHTSFAAHIVVWIRREDSAACRLFVRAFIGSSGVFATSNGVLEREILDAITNGQAPVGHADDSPVIEPQWESAIAGFRRAGWSINAASRNLGVFTATAGIAADAVATHIVGTPGLYQPGAAHATIWLKPGWSGGGTAMNCLVAQPGSDPPKYFPCAETLGARLSRAAAGDASGLPRHAPYASNNAFWWSVFPTGSEQAPAEVRYRSSFVLPAPIEQCWTAFLAITTQAYVVREANRQDGLLVFIASHRTTGRARLSAHPVQVRLTETALGVEASVSAPNTDDPASEFATEQRLLIQKVASELFLASTLARLLEAAQ